MEEQKIETLYQFVITPEAANQVSSQPYSRGTTSLRRLMTSYSYWNGHESHPKRLTSSGWYLTSASPTIKPDGYHEIDVFEIYRFYLKDYSLEAIVAEDWKYFTPFQTISIGDIIDRGGAKLEIISISLYGPDRSLSFGVRSLVTGTESAITFKKIPLLKKYELSENQLRNIEKKKKEMEKRIEEARSSIPVELVPRNRLGMQTKYIKEIEI